MKNNKNFYIIGLGYVGLTFALYASSIIPVIGIERDKRKINQITKNNTDILENNIDNLISEKIKNKRLIIKDKLEYTESGNIFMITPGTPLYQNKKVNLTMIEKITDDLKFKIHDNDLILIRSTVKVGTSLLIRKKLRKFADVSVCFTPERTIEGDAINEIKNLPQIVGASTKKEYLIAKDFFNTLCINVLPMISLEEAEIAKLLCNSERDLYFALANEIGLLSEKIGVNAYKIINSCKFNYPRSFLMKPGLTGGPCLEKDPYILKQSFPDFNFKLLVNSRNINESIVKMSIKKIKNIFSKNRKKLKKVAILGCAFKGTPITADIRGSLIYQINFEIKKINNNIKINFHDFNSTKVNLQDKNLKSSDNLSKVIVNSDLIILQNNHPDYRKFDWDSYVKNNCNVVIYDFWNQLDLDFFDNYYSFGVGLK